MIQLRFSNPSKLSVILVREELTMVTSKFDKKKPMRSLFGRQFLLLGAGSTLSLGLMLLLVFFTRTLLL